MRWYGASHAKIRKDLNQIWQRSMVYGSPTGQWVKMWVLQNNMMTFGYITHRRCRVENISHKINSLAPWRLGGNLRLVFFKPTWMINILSFSCEIVLQCINAARSHWWIFNIGSGNCFVPSGIKLLPRPITHSYFWFQSDDKKFYTNIPYCLMTFHVLHRK